MSEMGRQGARLTRKKSCPRSNKKLTGKKKGGTPLQPAAVRIGSS